MIFNHERQKDRWFVSASINGNYLDERFFLSYQQSLLFASGVATVLGAIGSPDGQVIIMDRKNNKVKELFILDSQGETAGITGGLKELIDRKFRAKKVKEDRNNNGNEIVKLN